MIYRRNVPRGQHRRLIRIGGGAQPGGSRIEIPRFEHKYLDESFFDYNVNRIIFHFFKFFLNFRYYFYPIYILVGEY